MLTQPLWLLALQTISTSAEQIMLTLALKLLVVFIGTGLVAYKGTVKGVQDLPTQFLNGFK